MREFVMRDEAFKLGLTEKVPMPEEGECFLLYKMGMGPQESMMIHYGLKYSSAGVRHGHFNKKATLSLKDKNLSENYTVVMLDCDFYFKVRIQMSYALEDVQKYFFQTKIEEDEIRYNIRKTVRKHDGKWDVQQGWQMQNALQDAIENQMKQYEGIRFRLQEVDVTPDESAVKMLQANRDKTVKIHDTKAKTDEKIVENEQAARVVESEQALKLKHIEDLAFMMKNFGNMGPIVDEYIKGNMDGTALYEYIVKAKKDNMNVLNMAVTNDLLTQKEAFERLNEIIENNGFLKGERQLPNEEKDATKEKIEADEGENESPADGDYI